jgi:hypothetical protein
VLVTGRGVKTDDFDVHAPPRATATYNTYNAARHAHAHEPRVFVYYTYVCACGSSSWEEGCYPYMVFLPNAIIACARTVHVYVRGCAYSTKYTRVLSCAKHIIALARDFIGRFFRRAFGHVPLFAETGSFVLTIFNLDIHLRMTLFFPLVRRMPFESYPYIIQRLYAFIHGIHYV